MQYKSIMKKHIKLVTSILLLFTSVSLSAATDGSNIDFSQGFAGWKRYLGTFKCDNPTAPDNDKTYSYSWSEVNSTDRITFITEYNTLDPIIRCSDHYLYTNPDPGKVVARLGVPKKTEGYSGGGGAWSNELSLIYTMPAKKKCECPVTYW